MIDPRIKKSAEVIVNHSTRVKTGDVVRITCGVPAKPLALEVYRLCVKNGAHVKLAAGFDEAAKIFFDEAKPHQLMKFPKISMYEAKNTDVFINIGGEEHPKILMGVDPKKITTRRKVVNPISEYIVNIAKKRWLGFEYPTKALAKEAKMSLKEYENFVFGSVLLDWNKENKKMYKLARILDKTDKVRIVGPQTDLRFSVKGMHALPDDKKYEGQFNMPDGEVFTAPVKNSVNGKIYYEYPALYNGNEVIGIKLEFKNGAVVKTSAKKNEKFLKQMIAADPGSKYLGELGIGLNKHIKKFTGQILFDEKMFGTIHLALGMAYKETKGTNKSAVHWDMIKDMRKGKIYFDDKLVFKNGKWLVGYK
ncbi:aminopeptidase [Nanoarchaeota archaeon]